MRYHKAYKCFIFYYVKLFFNSKFKNLEINVEESNTKGFR